MLGVVALERNEAEARIVRARLLHRHKGARADAVVLSAIADKPLQRLCAFLAKRLVLLGASATGLDHEVEPVKPAVHVVLGRKYLKVVFRRQRERARNQDIGVVLVLKDAGADGICDLGRNRRRLGNRLRRERAERRERSLRVCDTRHAALALLRGFRRASPRENTSAAREKRLCAPRVVGVKPSLRLGGARAVGCEHGVDAPEIPVRNLRLVERNDVELIAGHEPLHELGRLDAERIVAHEADDELSAPAPEGVPFKLAPRQEAERALQDVVIVFVALGMDGKHEQTSLAVRARDRGGLTGHRRTLLVALRVDVAVVRRDNFYVRVLYRNRRQRHGAFRIADELRALLDSRELLGPAVERNRNLGLAARRPELERYHVEHVRMALRRLHQETASRARADVAAAVPDERLDLLAPVRAKSLRLFDRRAAGHHEDVRRVKCAATHRLAVHRRRDDVLRPRSKLKPAECADVARTPADEHGDPKRLLRVGSGNAVPRTRPHAPSSRGNHGNGNQRLNLHT